MRRLLLIVPVFVATLWLAFALRRTWLETKAAHPEITLADGTVLQVEGLTWGTNQTLRVEPAWWSEVKRRLPPAWQARIGFPRDVRQISGDLNFHLWLSHLNPATGAYLAGVGGSFAHVASDGAEFRSSGGTGFGSGRAAEAPRFDVVDWRAETLRFRLKKDGQVHEFNLPNPRRGERFPLWSPEPLPQTRVAGEFAFTLGELTRMSPQRREWKPQLTVAAAGRDASAWFNLQPLFVDPTGNRHWTTLPASEPVWGLDLVASPSARYPFPDGRAFSLGQVRLPEAGKFALLPVSAAATNAGLHFAWVTGPGSFKFRDGQNLSASPTSIGSSGGSSNPGNPWEVSNDSDQPLLWLLLRGPVTGAQLLPAATNPIARLLPRLRRADGSFLEGVGQGYTASDDGGKRSMLLSFDLAGSSASEVMDLDLFLVEPLQVRFTFAPPAAK